MANAMTISQKEYGTSIGMTTMLACISTIRITMIMAIIFKIDFVLELMA